MPNSQMPSAYERINKLLAKLPHEELNKLLPLLESVTLSFKHVVYEVGGTIDYAYFPTGAVFSALTVMEDGTAIEVANVGNEGLMGHTATAVTMTSANRVIVQISGGAFRIEARALRAAATRSEVLKELLNRYHTAYLVQVSQSVACNGLHRLEQRCCRWLLTTRDRVVSDDLRLTHEFLSIMLGAARQRHGGASAAPRRGAGSLDPGQDHRSEPGGTGAAGL